MEMDELINKQKYLMDRIPHGHVIAPKHQGRVVAAIGIMEETLEYLNAIGHKSWRPNPLCGDAQLEELTDIFFFYLELIVLSGFTWKEIEREYHRKHEVNLDRYRKAQDGDYTWDKRGTEKGL